jgi:RHH-type transcriptional regulator, rel operon repressor / antitoxin RelB
MAISLRISSRLDHELEKIAIEQGTSKSGLIRLLITDFVGKKSKHSTPWELGDNVFGRYGSGKGNLSRDRKSILKEKVRAKKSRD